MNLKRGIRQDLERYVLDVFGALPRSDQRVKAGAYLRGVLTDGRRKSMWPMAERVGVDYQQIQQFVSSSTWPVEPVRARIARLAQELVDPVAWVVDDTGFPKDGKHSPCVARQYSGSLGKVGNCQVAPSLHLATDVASVPVNWRLFVPERWDDSLADDGDAETVAARRAAAKIPATERHREKWRMALEMIDETTKWGLRPGVICADPGYGDCGDFRTALTDRGLSYVVGVKGDTGAHAVDTEPDMPPYSGSGRPPTARYRTKPLSLKQHAIRASTQAAQTITWRKGTIGPLRSRYVIIQVRPANRHIPRQSDGTLPITWMIAEWPPKEEEPTKYWLSNLHPSTRPKTLVQLAKIRWRIEHDYRELKTGLGLDHFEGRSWLGWHHHVTLTSAAHLFITKTRLTNPKAPAPAHPQPFTKIIREIQHILATWAGACHTCHQILRT